MRKLFTRPIAVALTAATIATSLPLTQASAASAPAVSKAASVTSDFSARRRGGAGAAVALGAFALIAGAAIAASRRDDCGPYGCGYAYAPAPGPYYGYGYGPGYYGHRHWHHWR